MKIILNPRDRVRENTPDNDIKRIDNKIEENIKRYSSKTKEEISERIAELDKEWDIERILETNASILALTGLLMGLNGDKRWFVLPGLVLTFLLQHSVQGWCPPVTFLRKINRRTRQEIDKEKYALKVLRGDFDKIADIESIDKDSKPDYALDAVK